MARSLGDCGLETPEVACDLTLQTGVISAAIVLNEMRRLTDAAKPKALKDLPLSTPTLTVEPVADCSRYDTLRTIDRTARLKNLHLYGMAAAWSDWQAEYALQQKPVMPEVWLDRLIEAEQVDRQARSLSYQLKAARFPLLNEQRNLYKAKRDFARSRYDYLVNSIKLKQASSSLSQADLDQINRLLVPDTGRKQPE